MSITFNFPGSDSLHAVASGQTNGTSDHFIAYDWFNVDSYCIYWYLHALDLSLSHVDIPFEIICSGNTECNDACVKQIDDYYNKITLCILHACDNVIPKRKNLLDTDYYTVAGWNEHVKDQYDIIDLAVTALFRSHLKKWWWWNF